MNAAFGLLASRIVCVACAWCRQTGRPSGAIREVGGDRWIDVPHQVALMHAEALTASHGLCPDCFRHLQRRRRAPAQR